jgi:inorganic pyrophosphatase
MIIPSTYMTPGEGGDGDALDILLISEHLATGTVIEAIPIAVLLFMDDGEKDSKIIAIPSNANLRIINAENFAEIESAYPIVLQMISDWFLNYKGADIMKLEGTEDEVFAYSEIDKWMKK